MSDDTATSELRNRKLNRDAEPEFVQETVEEKIPSKWQQYKDNLRVWYHYPNELLNSVLGNTTLHRYTTFFIFGLAASSFLSLWFSDASFTITSWIYFKLFGLVYFGAFYGLWIQADGLVGDNGIAPIAQTLNDLDQYLQLTSSTDKVPFIFRRRGPSTPEAEPVVPSKLTTAWKSISSPLQKYFPSQYAYAANMSSKLAQFPTLFWFSTSQKMLHGLFYAGMTASALLVLGVGPAPLLLLTMYACYLSFMHVFDEFLALQWDVLLLESGFASFVLSLSSHGLNMFHMLPSQVSEPSKLPIFVIWWLVFRLMFASGVVKLTSRDKTWANLTAMSYHYRTQPLPTPSSLYMHNLPLWVHKVETLGTFVIELVFPLLMFGPSWMRAFAALSFTFLNATISLTGNYGFFNVLTIVLSVLLVEDKYWTLDVFAPTSWQLPSIGLSAIVEIPAFALVAAASIAIMNRAWRCTVMVPPKFLSSIVKKVSSFYLVSSYGLFAVMTTKRIELIIEGSEDGTNWIPYEFKYKPGDVRRSPPFIPGHMPRLDWRMWFCAFHKYPNIPNWFTKLLKDLAAGKPDVMNLLEKCPFDASNPPRFMRVQRYDYTFSTAQELKETGQWWQRSEREPLFRGMLRFPTPAS